MRLKNKNAISLIVLVITILVLTILAATVIISLSNTNIISQASDAVNKTEMQQIEEAKTLMQADGMLGNNPEDVAVGDTIISWDNENLKVVYKQLHGYPVKEGAIIPSGFYYVGGTKDTGLVISDDSADENKGVDYTCVGNQFVWVPVDDYSKFVRGGAELDSATNTYKMTGALDSSFAEPYANGYATEKEEYDAMCASVQKYGGFYIARFEAGDGDATSAREAITTANTVVSKKNKFVYNYVPWGADMDDIGTTGAVYLSQNMYKNHPTVVSTLCYGVQWDATMNFVSDANHNIMNSMLWGNYSNSMYDVAILQKTGANESWKAKNIYDLAGNVWEWTMEASGDYYDRSTRSGFYLYTGERHFPASSRGAAPIGTSQEYYGFRPTLYIK